MNGMRVQHDVYNLLHVTYKYNQVHHAYVWKYDMICVKT